MSKEVQMTVEIKNISYYEFKNLIYEYEGTMEPYYPEMSRLEYLFKAIENATDETYGYAYGDYEYGLSGYLASCYTTLSKQGDIAYTPYSYGDLRFSLFYEMETYDGEKKVKIESLIEKDKFAYYLKKQYKKYFKELSLPISPEKA